MFTPQQLFRVLFYTPGIDGWGLPMLLWGIPGSIKTAMVRREAARLGLPCEVLAVGERGEGAFGVTPVPISKAGGGMVISYPPPDWTEPLVGSGRGVVFVDELNSASPALQPTLQGLLLARRIGGAYLGHGARMIGASNDVADAAGGWDLAAPVANRLGHYTWPGIPQDDWADWLTSGAHTTQAAEVRPEELEAAVMEAWATAFASAAALVAGFVRANPKSYHDMPPSGSAAASKAWPSPRTLEYATRAIAGCAVHSKLSTGSSAKGGRKGRGDVGDSTVGFAALEHELIACFVGSGVAKGLVAYKKAMDLPNPADILDGKLRFEPSPTREDRTMVVLRACASLIIQTKDKSEDLAKRRAIAFWDMVASDDYPTDVIFPSSKQLLNCGMHAPKESDKVLRKIGPALVAAGMQAKG